MENYPAVDIFCELWPFGTSDANIRTGSRHVSERYNGAMHLLMSTLTAFGAV